MQRWIPLLRCGTNSCSRSVLNNAHLSASLSRGDRSDSRSAKLSQSTGSEGKTLSSGGSQYYSKSRIGREYREIVNLWDRRKFLRTSMLLCANDRIVEAPDVKVEIAENSFEQYTQTGMKADTSLYNLLLEVYCFNNKVFQPSEFLNRMKKDNCFPNHETFDYFMETYGKQGNLSAISAIQELSKSMGFPVSERFYAAMVTGHSRSGDLEAALGVIATMEADGGQKKQTAVYSSLLSAYAEQGLLEEVKKTHYLMKEKEVSPCTSVYTAVLDTLSRSGYGRLVADTLAFIKQEGWPVPDLHPLCLRCLCRGEFEAPFIFLSHLSSTPHIEELIDRCFICGMNNGLTFKEALERVKQQVDIESFKWIIPTLATSIVCSHYNPILSKEHVRRLHQCPRKQMLPQHPWGKRWLSATRDVLRLLSTKKQLRDYMFYPLLARHCSDGDIEEMIKTVYVMLNLKLGMFSDVRRYIEETFRNAGKRMDEFFSSPSLYEDTDSQWLVALLAFQCLHGEWTAATRTLDKMKGTEDIVKHSDVLDYALKHLWRPMNMAQPSLDFIKALSHTDACSKLLSNFYWIDGRLNMRFFNGLLMKGVKFSMEELIFSYNKMSVLKSFDFTELWVLLDKAKYEFSDHHDAVNGLLYKSLMGRCCLKSRDLDKSVQLYEVLSEKKKKEYDIRCLRVVQLIRMKKEKEALQEFQLMVEMKRPIPELTFKSVVRAAYLSWDAHLAEELLEKMKENGVFPESSLLYYCLRNVSNYLTKAGGGSNNVESLDKISPDTVGDEVNSPDTVGDEVNSPDTVGDEVNSSDTVGGEVNSLDTLGEEVNSLNTVGDEVNSSDTAGDKVNEPDRYAIRKYKQLALLHAELGNVNKVLEIENLNVLSSKAIQETTVLAMLNADEVHQAMDIFLMLRHFSPSFLRTLMNTLVFNGHDHSEWKNVLVVNNVPGKLVDTMLFFAYLDNGLLHEAKMLLQQMKYLHQEELSTRLSWKDGYKYHKILTDWDLNQLSGGSRKSTDSRGSTNRIARQNHDSKSARNEISELCAYVQDSDSQ